MSAGIGEYASSASPGADGPGILEAARLRALRHDVRQRVENRPGIYRMIGPAGETVYVGKSVRVRSRLLSYFRAETGEKAGDILAATGRIVWEPVQDEFTALLREMRLIRRFRPAFNVEHKRNRGFSFIRVEGGPGTRFTVTGRVRADGAGYYGPFRGRTRVRDALRELLDVLQLRDCPAAVPMRFADQGELFEVARFPECLRGELSRCLAPCAGACSEAAYQARVETARAFLEGRSDTPLRTVEARMWAAANRLEYEHAVLLRERVERLRALRDQLMMLKRETRALTVAYAPRNEAGSPVYLLRRGAIAAELTTPKSVEEGVAFAARARRVARGPRVPLHALDSERLMEVLLVTRWFRSRPEELARTTPLEKVDARWRPPPHDTPAHGGAGDVGGAASRSA